MRALLLSEGLNESFTLIFHSIESAIVQAVASDEILSPVEFNCNAKAVFTLNCAASPVQAGFAVKSPSEKLSVTCASERKEIRINNADKSFFILKMLCFVARV